MRRVAVKIAYLGDEFVGSQIQPDVRTVEGEVLSNLATIRNGSDPDLKCASRTDRGVNALGNVIIFNTVFDDDLILLRALNAVSKGVFYRSSADVNTDFNPRHADERIYHYMLPATDIDADLLKKCALLFVGEHDFIRFCKPDDRPTKMNMRSIVINETDDVFIMEFRSEYFLRNLIRRIVAALSAVGHGDASLDDVERALDGGPVSFGTARPDALTLMDVIYKDVEFRTPATDMFRTKVEEEIFKVSLRSAFFSSL